MLPVFPCPQLLALALAFLGTVWTVEAVWTSGRKQCPAFPATPRLASLHQFGIKCRVQREDGSLKPSAQHGIGNALHTDTFLAIVQQEAVSVTVITTLMREPPGLAVLAVIHSRYVHSSCICSFPGVTRKMLSTFCLIMPYSFSSFFTSLYCSDTVPVLRPAFYTRL